MTSGLQVREREFAVLDVPATPRRPPKPAPAPGAKVDEARRRLLVDLRAAPSDRTARCGSSSAGSIASTAGARAKGLTLERDASLDPVNLAVDKAGNLLVLSADGPEGTVYSSSPARRRPR